MSFLHGKNSYLTDNFIYSDLDVVSRKIKEFKDAGKDSLQLVLDFDRTLTEKNSQSSVSWQLMRNHLPPEGKKEAQAVFDYYRAIELDEELTAADALAWWNASMSIITKYRLDMNIVEKEFLKHSTIRPGAKELFDFCNEHNIPTIIMSAGIKDVIEIWCKMYNVKPTMVLSTSLKLDANNRVIGWEENTMVHTLNKKEIDHPELTKIRSQKSHTILVGDSMHDFDMAEGDEAVFRIRIVDYDEKNVLDQVAIREKSLNLFDVIIEDGTFNPVLGLVKEIASK